MERDGMTGGETPIKTKITIAKYMNICISRVFLIQELRGVSPSPFRFFVLVGGGLVHSLPLPGGFFPELPEFPGAKCMRSDRRDPNGRGAGRRRGCGRPEGC